MKPRKSPKPAPSKPEPRGPKRQTRQRFSIQEKLDLLRQFEAEGLPVAAFCKARGLKYNLYKWLEALRRGGPKAFKHGRGFKPNLPKYQKRRYVLTEGARPEPARPLDRRIYAALARAGRRGLTMRALANKVGREVSQIWHWLAKAETEHQTVRRIEGPRLRESHAALKAGLIRALAEAGRSGIRTRDLANRFQKKDITIHQALSSLCKAGLVQKAARGVYRLKRSSATPARLVRKTCGTTRDLVLAALKAAGPAGLGLKTLAPNLGLSNWQLGHWFATAGKRCPEIERIGYGVYRLRPAA